MANVLIDTCAWEELNFDFSHPKTEPLVRLASQGLARVYSTTMVDSEIRRHVKKKWKIASNSLRNTLKDNRIIHNHKSSADIKHTIHNWRELLELSLIDLDKFYKSVNKICLSEDYFSLPDLIRRHEEGHPPFREPGSHKDFPDAITSVILEHWISRTSKQIIFVGRDRRLSAHLESNRLLLSASDFDALNILLEKAHPLAYHNFETDSFISSLASRDISHGDYISKLSHTSGHSDSDTQRTPPKHNASTFSELLDIISHHNIKINIGSNGGFISRSSPIDESSRSIANRFRARLGLYATLLGLENDTSLLGDVHESWTEINRFYALWLVHLFYPENKFKSIRLSPATVIDIHTFCRSVTTALKHEAQSSSSETENSLSELYQIYGGEHERISRPEIVRLASRYRSAAV